MQIENGKFCPLIKKDCVGLKCAWFTKVVGYDTNTGKEIEDYQCAVGWLPLLLIENAGRQRQTGAAIESFRNEMVKSSQIQTQLMVKATETKNPKVIEVAHEIDNNSK
jgi:hypothetical protein